VSPTTSEGLECVPEFSEKNTFIHFKLPMNESNEFAANCQEFSSAPGIVMEQSFRTKQPTMEERHKMGNCKPCAYFLYKTDGCRNADDCEFCHLCEPGEKKRRQKEKRSFFATVRKQLRDVPGHIF